MPETCIVVADLRGARFYGIESTDAARVKSRLVERGRLKGGTDVGAPGQGVTGRARTETHTSRKAGPMHPMNVQSERHRLERYRRFAGEVAAQSARLVAGWPQGTLVVVAEPKLLGLLRGPLRAALPRAIRLKELAKEYSRLGPAELHDQLARYRLVPAAGRNSQ